MRFALFLLMKNTSKSNLARKNICKSIWLSKIVSPAKSNLAITDDYSKVKINFYWDCDAWNPMRLTFYDLNFWITNWCFVNPISFCECQNFLTWPKSFSLLNITFWTISKTFWYSQNWNWISKTGSLQNVDWELRRFGHE